MGGSRRRGRARHIVGTRCRASALIVLMRSPARVGGAALGRHRRRSCGSRRDQRGRHHAAAQLRRPRPACCFLIYDPWKDPTAAGQPTVGELPAAERLSLLGSTTVHAGIVIAIVATVARVVDPALDPLGLPAAGRRRQPRGGPPGRSPGRHAAAQRHGRRRRAGRPRRLDPARRRRVQAPAASSPTTATSASWPAGWPATDPIKVACAAVLLAAIAVGRRQPPDRLGRSRRPPSTS